MRHAIELAVLRIFASLVFGVQIRALNVTGVLPLTTKTVRDLMAIRALL